MGLTTEEETLEEKAKRLYLQTRNGMGFSLPEWDDLQSTTKAFYRACAIERSNQDEHDQN